MTNDSEIKKAAKLLQTGKLAAFPTETVYGLGGNALSDEAVARIYEMKSRPQFNPLIVHVASLAEAEQYAELDDRARRLAKYFWPGPLTLVLPRKPGCKLSWLAGAGLDSIAIRIPAHPLARALLEEAKLPVAAPSANRSGHVSPTRAQHVREEFGDDLFVLDGGDCDVGIESTVLDLTTGTPVILRPGAVTEEMLRDVIEVRVGGSGDAIKSPGMLERHYAPSKKLRLNVKEVREGEALLAFGSPIAGAPLVENLSLSADLREAAANLFAMLRKLDASPAASIAAMPIPEKGLGVAINDRFRRAAT